MNAARLAVIAGHYSRLRIAVVGDVCLDRYLEIDPARTETSLETGLPVYNVVKVRSQAGAAGTIVNNLAALGIGEIHAVGFCGDDGEGYELRRALAGQPGVKLEHFITATERRTFTYCKPLVIEPGQSPRELPRLDSKNWTTTPDALQQELARRAAKQVERVDALVLMDQVDEPQTGVVTDLVCDAVRAALDERPRALVLADSRGRTGHFSAFGLKMNAAELGRLRGTGITNIEEIKTQAADLARRNAQPVFVTLAERGIVGALPGQPAEFVPALAVRGPIDIVGAGDAVTANLAAALAAGASLTEAMELAMAAASLAIHQLGTTGTASMTQIAELLAANAV